MHTHDCSSTCARDELDQYIYITYIYWCTHQEFRWTQEVNAVLFFGAAQRQKYVPSSESNICSPLASKRPASVPSPILIQILTGVRHALFCQLSKRERERVVFTWGLAYTPKGHLRCNASCIPQFSFVSHPLPGRGLLLFHLSQSRPTYTHLSSSPNTWNIIKYSVR
jgi:hypothetical protein